MSNAAKHRKKAAEFEHLRQIDRAIASYIKAIEEGEAEGEDIDVALYNKVGDLALRQGRVPDAITYYERAIEHYATSGLFNNAIALCNKVLRSAPGRTNVYFTLGRICARKGLRGDATRNFLEYATRMQQEGRLEEGVRALAEVADLMPEMSEVHALVEEFADRAGIALPRRRTPAMASRAEQSDDVTVRDPRSPDLVFIHVDYGQAAAATTPAPASPPAPLAAPSPVLAPPPAPAPVVQAPPVVHAPPVVQAPTVVELPPLAIVPLVSDEPPVVEADVTPLAGLEPTGDYALDGIALVDGFSSEELGPLATESLDLSLEVSAASHDRSDDVEVGVEFDVPTELPWLEPEVPSAAAEQDMRADDALVLELLELEPVPELDAAQEDGARAAMLGARAEPMVEERETFHIDPHDFIQVGELPPLVLDDAIVDEGAIAAQQRAWDVVDAEAITPIAELATVAWPTPVGAAPAVIPTPIDAAPVVIPTPIDATPVVIPTPIDATPVVIPTPIDATPVVIPTPIDATPVVIPTPIDAAPVVIPTPIEEATTVEPIDSTSDADEQVDATPIAPASVVRPTPALPIAAVAVEAAAVASSRRDALRAAVQRLPSNWALRRRLAEALLESGDREAALAELEVVRQGMADAGDLAGSAEVSDEMVAVGPDRIPFHQRRVELAIRLHDLERLQYAYLDLADALVRMGEEARARAVYVRVLELDPHDMRARTALGAAAPPPPPPVADGYVDLATWLRHDDEPSSTRLRMHEPEVTGNEQADFEALLRHFKEGVSRSLGEDDFESHYDLGVAYKEMGLLDDAIAEFQKALRGQGNRLPAYEALGQCFVEQGRFQVAATVLSRALHEPGLGDDQRVGVLYLLAISCESLQRWDEARSYFHRVYATDITFRDVAARLAALEQAAR
ncbi:MAG: tetratricopeptide repeat protein [Gemmatimonadetes bacterium]|nr:tetratricopeptide repeat protein [Gemmatimonadota bacterium]